MLITNTQYIANYNRKVLLLSQIFKAVATIRGTGKI